MRIVPTLDSLVLTPTKSSLDKFMSMLRQIYQNLATAFNGNISFGDGTYADNINGVWANVLTPVAPNTNFTITHNLGRVPVGYLPMRKSAACDVFTGSVAPTTTQLTLQATVGSVVLRLFIFGLVLSLFSLSSRAQGYSHTNTAQVTITPSGNTGLTGNLLEPIPGATITVCNGSALPAPGVVCTGLASIYSTIALSSGPSLPNPTSADINGNFTFFVTPGQSYIVSVSSVTATPYSYVLTAPLVSATLIGANTSLSNLSSLSINTSLLPQIGVSLGSPANQFKDLYLYSNGTYGSNFLHFQGTPTSIRNVTFPDASDTVVYVSLAQALQNKTISVSGNTLVAGSNIVGHYLRNNGTQYVDSIILAVDLPASTGNCGGSTSFSIGQNAGGSEICSSVVFPSAAVAVQSYNLSTLGSNVGMSSGVLTTINSKSVTMPSSGGPFRVQVCFDISYTTGASATNADFYVTDGTNLWGRLTTGAGVSPVPINGGARCSFSPVTYTNSSGMTFTLKGQSNQNITVLAAPSNAGPNSTFEVVVMQSN